MIGTKSNAPVLTEREIFKFWANVDIQSKDECWKWTKSTTVWGYGQFVIRGRHIGCHVLARYLFTGEWPIGLCTCHSCDIPECCNPYHLWLGTDIENRRDSIAKGRNHRGERHWFKLHPEECVRGDNHWTRKNPERVRRGELNVCAKLTEADVLEIRALYATGNYSQGGLGGRFGVNQTTIGEIVRREIWRHI